MVIIDYMQLIQGTGTGSRRSDNRVQEVSDMTRALKLLARELAVPVILLAQLNRGPETRQDHRPLISDLRESGSIEQDADLVILLYRPVVYDPDAGNEAEAIVAKNRHGPIETIDLVFEGMFTRFRTLYKEDT
jgi:replicative DNA helicase